MPLFWASLNILIIVFESSKQLISLPILRKCLTVIIHYRSIRLANVMSTLLLTVYADKSEIKNLKKWKLKLYLLYIIY